MIKTATQLKALIRNQAGGDSGMAQMLLRNYAMERFLERMSLSDYKDNFILKGGMLISAVVGSHLRATMDIDTTIRNYPLEIKTINNMVAEISDIRLDDNMTFKLKDVSPIMEEADYSGVRVTMDAYLDKTRIPLKVDISTGDVITPGAVRYTYKLMFEERSIAIWTYNMETVLAEKLETIISRASINTRMRDYYDVYVLTKSGINIDLSKLREALAATSRRRRSEMKIENYQESLLEIQSSNVMKNQWDTYQRRNSYVGELEWDIVCMCVENICRRVIDET